MMWTLRCNNVAWGINTVMSANSCLWTAWGEVVCTSSGDSTMGQGLKTSRSVGGREYFFAGPPASPAPPAGTGKISCSGDSDCDSRSRCNNLVCRSCSDIGCVAGKACETSSDCAAGLSCQNNTCTVGGIPTHLNNSAATITSGDTDTVGQSYEAQRQAYIALGASGDASVTDCALYGTCAEGYPCDTGSWATQCAQGLLCDSGVCKSSYSGL